LPRPPEIGGPLLAAARISVNLEFLVQKTIRIQLGHVFSLSGNLRESVSVVEKQTKTPRANLPRGRNPKLEFRLNETATSVEYARGQRQTRSG
jgi:hypothetical protein